MDDLKQIKKHYGENMAHFCRDAFPTILETPGLLFDLISSKFAYTKDLYDDLKEDKYNETHTKVFIDFINSLITIREKDKLEEINKNKTPKELLKEAGYTLYECKTEKDIQSFRKYYKKREELCTFKGNRLDSCHVFFAVKENADKLKREDFIGKEDRQDEYGTSVISIQFTRGKTNQVSIKNRYNHTVSNPDATFNNDLDNIIPGLTKAFEKTFNLDTKSDENIKKVDFPGYVLANDGKYHKYNFEKDNVYYCPDNKIIDISLEDSLFELDKSQYIVFDIFILDLKRKMIFEYNGDKYYHDSFIDELQDIKTIDVKVDKTTKNKTITINGDIIIVLNSSNRMIEYKNSHITSIGDNFIEYYSKLRKISLPNVEKAGDFFAHASTSLEEVYMPKVKSFGNNCFTWTENIKSLNLPSVETIGDDFISHRHSKLKIINAPKLKKVGYNFLCFSKIKYLNIPNIKEAGADFLSECIAKDVYLPNLEKVHTLAFSHSSIENLRLPKLKHMGSEFLVYNKVLKSIDLPNIETISQCCLENNTELETLSLPKAKKIENQVLLFNEKISELNLPLVKEIGTDCFLFNISLTSLCLPNVEKIGTCFLEKDYSLKTFVSPKLRELGENTALQKYNIEYTLQKEEKVKSKKRINILSRLVY